ncbi:MAG: hypothetical protein K2L45_09785 [Muribaculaceae bacterium]|nr:hypothetical protein [Muribaculaceae bacterium]
MKKFFLTLTMAATTILIASAREPKSGYRGFVDLDCTIGKAYWFSSADGYYKHEGLLYLGFTTSHGYQINRHAYVGAGFMMSLGFPSLMLPVFADFRYDRSFGKFTPYGDVRIGYSFSDGGGMYFSPIVGYRVNLGRKANFNIGVGLTLCGQTHEKYITDCQKDETSDEYECIVYYVGTRHIYDPRFSLRFGFDF